MQSRPSACDALMTIFVATQCRVPVQCQNQGSPARSAPGRRNTNQHAPASPKRHVPVTLSARHGVPRGPARDAAQVRPKLCSFLSEPAHALSLTHCHTCNVCEASLQVIELPGVHAAARGPCSTVSAHHTLYDATWLCYLCWCCISICRFLLYHVTSTSQRGTGPVPPAGDHHH